MPVRRVAIARSHYRRRVERETDGVMADKPRIAVLGAGRWGRNLVRNFAALEALAAVCDLDPAVRAEFAGRYPHARTVRDFETVLGDPGIDAVAVATPSHTHGALVRAALEAGKSVFVEKPMCMDLGEAEALNALAERRRRVLMVGHLLLYHPAFVAMRDFVHDGAIGDPTYLYSQRLNFRGDRGADDALWDFAPHDVSMLLAIAGELPVTVHATGSATVDPGVIDTVLAQATFAGALRAHLFVSWMQPVKEQRLVVIGQGGAVVFDDMLPGPRKLTCYPHEVQWNGRVPHLNREEARPIPFAATEPLAVECAHFLECVASGRAPVSDGDEGYRVLRVLDACVRSLRDASPVTLPAPAAPWPRVIDAGRPAPAS